MTPERVKGKLTEPSAWGNPGALPRVKTPQRATELEEGTPISTVFAVPIRLPNGVIGPEDLESCRSTQKARDIALQIVSLTDMKPERLKFTGVDDAGYPTYRLSGTVPRGNNQKTSEGDVTNP